MADPLVSLEDVLITGQLLERPSRAPDYARENKALVTLAQFMADAPHSILQSLVDVILDVTQAHSAGISLLSKGGMEERFHWPAIAGAWKDRIGQGTPRSLGPSGDVLDQMKPLLFHHLERRYTYFLPFAPYAVECLMVPFQVEGVAIGTIWVISHDEHRTFDSEDLRLLVSFSAFASSACQVAALLNELEPGIAGSVSEHRELIRSLTVLRNANIQAQETRRAAVNLMEDAVMSRQEMEAINRQLIESQSRFEAVFDTSPMGMYLVDRDLRIRQLSRQARTVFGDIKELIGSDFVKVIHMLWPKDSADAIVSRFRHTLATGEPYRSDEFIETRIDRNVREYYDWEIHRLALPGGQHGVVCYFIDISGRILAEQSVREHELRQRLIMDSMPQKIITATPDGEIDYCSPQWTEFTGFSFEEMRGSGWQQFLHPDERRATMKLWKQAIESGEPFVQEQRFRQSDGTYRWQLTRTRALHDAKGNVAMWIGSSTDIDEQRQTANELRQYAADLSEADRRKNEFLAMLAHELRNPLAPMRNSVAVLQFSGTSPDAIQVAAEIMERQVTQMVRLVDDLLDVSRISLGKIELFRERIDLATIIANAVEAVLPLCTLKEHQLSVVMPSEPIMVSVDRVRMAQVVTNLLNNACKFTNRGGRITVAASLAGEDWVEIRVRDTGIGISREQLPRIFDLFTQVDASLERSISGLGIGLTLVKNLVQLHGGTVVGTSEGLGYGSEFVVRLPNMAHPVSERTHAAAPTNASRLAAHRMLIVDDNVDAATSLGTLLRLSGHETRIAYDGVEAVAAALAFRPNVILLDIGLPRLNGYEVCRRIREYSWGRRIVMVALTGWGQEDDRIKSKEAGFDAHLVKPVDHLLLVATLSRLLAATSTGPALT